MWCPTWFTPLMISLFPLNNMTLSQISIRLKPTAQGTTSFTPSEFDLSPYIREQGNMLAVEVYKNSTAAYLEDQDFFRFFGIFRNVTLYAKPKLHVEDLWVKPCPSEVSLKTLNIPFHILQGNASAAPGTPFMTVHPVDDQSFPVE